MQKENSQGHVVQEKKRIFRNFILGVKKGEMGQKGARWGSITTILFSCLHHIPQLSHAKGKWLEICCSGEKVEHPPFLGSKRGKRGQKWGRWGSITLILLNCLHCSPKHSRTKGKCLGTYTSGEKVDFLKFVI